MRFTALVFTAGLLTACANDPDVPSAGSTSTPGSTSEVASSDATGESGTEDSSTEDASSSSGEPGLEPIALDEGWVQSLHGAWLGPVTDTPMGDLPQFYWEFEWTDEDALVGVADSGMGFRFELEFAEQDGQWTMTETGTLPGNLTQSYVLHPVAREGARVRFEVLERPGFLQVDLEPGPDTFDMVVLLRGEPHGAFDLGRPG